MSLAKDVERRRIELPTSALSRGAYARSGWCSPKKNHRWWWSGGDPNTAGRRLGGQSSQKRYPSGGEFTERFHPDLSWSQYRALMRVENEEARNDTDDNDQAQMGIPLSLP